ncbi:YcxB family protein [Paenibacillus sacheonensis]|uniref:YcxB-like C-terminal domain-containing protein n=1 Tax=Paenibacillus sacheonensis TaxID=742054 RepID=A0A7X4YM35_9BACL|nr:YcxB family protein [Paenibacillus sacheonensis]NBC68815.1 hypothetical protein [Paenibacillus sacheonensis]
MQEIQFNFGSSLKQVNRAHYFHVRRNLIAISVFALIMLLFLAAIAMWDPWLLWVAIPTVVILSAFDAWKKFVLAPRRKMKDPRYNQLFTFAFDEMELSLSAPELSSKINVDYLVNVWENAEFYLLFHDKRNFWYIPKASFKNREQEQYFRAIILKHHRISTGIMK